jgi:segregation and condensation protein B
MAEISLKSIVEGLIMASDGPLSCEDIIKVLHSDNKMLSVSEIRELICELTTDYTNRGIELKEVASGWRFQVRQDLSPWVGKLWEERPPRYSRAFLETLALIAYRQPVTRAEIEEVRGVTVSSNIIKTMLEHEWVKIAGHKEVPGKPALFVTTKKFLDSFNLKSIRELPDLMEYTENLPVEENVSKLADVLEAKNDELALENIEPSLEAEIVPDDLITQTTGELDQL